MRTAITNTLLTLLLSAITALATAAESTPEGTDAASGHKDLSYAVQKSMDPNVWMKLMNDMMTGKLQGQPAIASCVGCHTPETSSGLLDAHLGKFVYHRNIRHQGGNFFNTYLQHISAMYDVN